MESCESNKVDRHHVMAAPPLLYRRAHSFPVLKWAFFATWTTAPVRGFRPAVLLGAWSKTLRNSRLNAITATQSLDNFGMIWRAQRESK
jgi:hypothetical protein